jgi:hypothetical protein
MRRSLRSGRGRFLVFVGILVLGAASARAAQYDIYGREAASSTLPGAFAYLSDSNGLPYQGVNPDGYGDSSYYSALAVILDTGSSGSLLSHADSTAFNVPLVTTGNGGYETYSDVGIGGAETFNVSQPVFLHVATMTSDMYSETIDPITLEYTLVDNTEDHSRYSPAGSYNFQVRQQDPIATSIFGEDETVSYNIVGTPVLNSRVMHVTPNVVNYSSLSPPIDYMQTELLTSMPNVSSPTGVLRAKLTYVDYVDHVTNPNTSVSTSTNPTIDGITVKRTAADGTLKSASSRWLLDTGASLTMMGANMAGNLGILEDITPYDATVDVAGVGSNSLTLYGYRVDSLTVPLIGGDELTFHDIVVFVSWTGLPVDLPGIFGMNLLGQSYDPTTELGFLTPTDSDFSDWYINPGDGETGELVMVLAPVPEASSFVLLAVGASLFLLRRRLGRRPI